jgi:hypothetical protein
MNYTFLLLALTGLVTHYLMQLASFNKGTPDLTFIDTVWNYFKINSFYALASLILTIVLSFLLNQDGGNELISVLTGGNVSTEKPFAYFLTAFIMGFGIDYILIFLRKIINPLKVTLNKD